MVETIGELINLSRRQRMLSQRIVLQMLLASQGDTAALDIARTCLSMFESAHCDLVAGNERLPGRFMVLADIIHEMDQLMPEIKDTYVRLEQAWLSYKQLLSGGNPNIDNA